MPRHAFLPALATAFLAASACVGARAETFHHCAGVIASVPTVITTQGTWCMDRDLSSALASGTMILVQANNVTIDCNGFKLGGLAAGPGTQSIGIRAVDRSSVVVRDCNVRGFMRGIAFEGLSGHGHLVEDNRLVANTMNAIRMSGTANIVRRNILIDTGRTTATNLVRALEVLGDADVLDNLVDGVHAADVDAPVAVFGLDLSATSGSVVRGNRFRGFDGGTGWTYGINALGELFYIEGNHLLNQVGTWTVAINCNGTHVVHGNRLHGFVYNLAGCGDHGENIITE